MEPETALVWANGGTELDPVAPVYMNAALVIHPGYPKADDPFRLYEGLDDSLLFIFGMLVNDLVQTLQKFQNGLVKFPLVRVPCNYLRINALQIFAF